MSTQPQPEPAPSAWAGITATTGIDGSLTLEYTEQPATPTDPERGYFVTNIGDHWTVSYGTEARSKVFATCTTNNNANIVRRAVELLAATEAAAVRGEPHTTPCPACAQMRAWYGERAADLIPADHRCPEGGVGRG